MAIRRICGGFFIALALAVVTVPSKRAMALEEERRSALQTEYDSLYRQMLADPANLEVTFRYAEVAIALGNYEAAVAALERMLLFNPDLPRVRLELGALYFRMGSYETARAYLERAVAGADVPADVRERVASLIAEIDRRVARHKLTGSLFAGGRYQSNATLGPSSGSVRAAGFDAVLDRQFQQRSDASLILSGRAHYSFDLQTQAQDFVEANGAFFWSEQKEVKEFDLSIYELDLGPRFELLPGTDFGASLRPYALGNVVFLGNNRFFWTAGGGLSMQRGLADWGVAELAYELRRKSFNETARRPAARELDSHEHTVVADIRAALTDQDFIGLTASASREVAREGFNANRLIGISGTYSHRFPLPYRIPEGPITVSISGSRLWTKFDDPDPLVDLLVTRFDREWRASLAVSAGIYGGIALVIEATRRFRDSNLPNFEFNNTTVTAGLAWRF